MKFSKLLLAVVGATVLLGALVSSASARNFSVSSLTNTASWRRMDFAGGFGTVECEVKLSGSLHARTSTKTIESLIGYITEGTVIRCARGSATIRQESLPWHRRYRGFVGTLPNITAQTETVGGAEWLIREPSFGILCTVSRVESRTVGTYTVSAGAITRADVSGESVCVTEGGTRFLGRLTGSETNVLERVGGSRITVTLI